MSEKKNESFCEWHISSDSEGGTLYCSAHLHEGLCLKCYLTLKNIQFGAEPGCSTKVVYISSTSSHYDGACKDFKPVNNLLTLLGINNFEELAKRRILIV